MNRIIDEEKLKFDLIQFTEMIKSDPKNGSLYYNLGNTNKKLGRYRESINNYTKAIELNPKDFDSFNNRGTVYQSKGDYERAISDYSQALKLNPEHSHSLSNRGLCYHKIDEHDKSIKDFSHAISLNPRLCDNYCSRGVVYMESGKLTKAIPDFQKTIELNPNIPIPYSNLGSCYEKLGDHSKSIEFFSKALKIDDKLFQVYYFRGLSYFHMKKYDLSINDFTKAIGIKSDYFEPYIDRGICLMSQEKFDDALKDFDYVIEKNKDSDYQGLYRAYHNRGLVFRHMNQPEKSIEDYSSSIVENPQSVDSLLGRGMAYHVISRTKKSLEDFTKVIELQPKNAKGYFFRSGVYRDAGEEEKAKDDLLTAKQLDPDIENVFSKDYIPNFMSTAERRLVRLQKELENLDFGDLKITKLLGKGCYGRTYLCVCSRERGSIEKQLVLKIYPKLETKKKQEESMERDSVFYQYHPNLAPILFHGVQEKAFSTKELFPKLDYEEFWSKEKMKQIESFPMILMEFYSGGNLEGFLKETKQGELTSLKVCEILHGIVKGSHYLHKKMIVHRDLHSGNVLFEEESKRVVVCDFGCSLDLRKNNLKFKVKKGEEVLHNLSSFGSEYYTKLGGAYVAPEITRAEKDPNIKEYDFEKTDVYSIGKIGEKLVDKMNRRDGEYDRVVSFVDKVKEEDKSKRLDFETLHYEVKKMKLICSRVCSACRRKYPKKRCSRCRKFYYCNTKCHRKHWREGHRSSCSKK